MSCALCPTPFAQQHLKLLGPPNSGRSVAEWAPSLKRATDACVLASNNASPAQRGPRRDAQPLHATPLAAVLFPAPLRARALFRISHNGPGDGDSVDTIVPGAKYAVVWAPPGGVVEEPVAMVVLCTTDCVPKLECPRDSRAALREVKAVSALKLADEYVVWNACGIAAVEFLCM